MMNLSPFHDEQAPMQETLLRVTLHEHAPQEVDLEQSWAVVSRQMASLDGKPQPGMSLRLLTPGNSRRLPRRTSWPLVAVAALVLALLGAGLAGPLSSWFGGRTSTPFAYAAINESVQISNGITLTATKGYVDPKHLVLYYDVRVSSDLSGKYAVAFAFVEKSTIQDKTVESVCETQANNPVFHCAIVFPSDGDIAGETFTVTWHISEMRLMSRYLLLPTHPTTVISTRMKTPAPTPTFIPGDWTLRFSLPFRHEVQDPLLISFPGEVPFAIPTSLSR